MAESSNPEPPSSAGEADEAARRTARIWRRSLLVVALVFVGAGLYLYLRGTLADSTKKDPSTAADGVVTRLWIDASGRKHVRCAAILPTPPDRVWQVITDYEHFPQIFESRLWEMQIDRVESLEAGDRRLVGRVASKLGKFSIDVRVHHQESEGTRVASWDESGDKMRINRGSWTVRPSKDGSTLLVYTLHVEMRRTPTFLVNNVLLSQAPAAVRAVQARAAAGR